MKKILTYIIIAICVLCLFLSTLTIITVTKITNGSDGKNGSDGINGKDGINGLDGKNGINGADGIDGKDGINGRDGADGKDGMNGKDGKDGKDGTQITISEDGYWVIDGVKTNFAVQGPKGDKGEKGDKGDKGNDGRNGIDGKDIKTIETKIENGLNLGYKRKTIIIDLEKNVTDNTQKRAYSLGKILSWNNDIIDYFDFSNLYLGTYVPVVEGEVAVKNYSKIYSCKIYYKNNGQEESETLYADNENGSIKIKFTNNYSDNLIYGQYNGEMYFKVPAHGSGIINAVKLEITGDFLTLY